MASSNGLWLKCPLLFEEDRKLWAAFPEKLTKSPHEIFKTLTEAEIPIAEDSTLATFSNLAMPRSSGSQGSKEPLHCPIRRQSIWHCQKHARKQCTSNGRIEEITGISKSVNLHSGKHGALKLARNPVFLARSTSTCDTSSLQSDTGGKE
ncbi:hypothetical protein T07_3393 [Trichinella nelsoni]|uniref:Uncharacterized protein n=1 Tax=Trichinella nelsoni TaxID=6336 RepID=A0A0V0RK61_9BILA|nr:hypothetical protein T07_3393 [Trichinella nelsoni]